MITRLVKMTFIPEKVEEFLEIFDTINTTIRNSEGCSNLKLVQDQKNNNVFFTISIWEDERFLELYRNTDFFKKTWSKTRKLFIDKAEAWTMQEVN